MNQKQLRSNFLCNHHMSINQCTGKKLDGLSFFLPGKKPTKNWARKTVPTAMLSGLCVGSVKLRSKVTTVLKLKIVQHRESIA